MDLQQVSREHLSAARNSLRDAKNVVVKVGSNVLVGGSASVIHRRNFVSLVESICQLATTRRVVFVTSGAVAVGRKQVRGIGGAADSIASKQALAAIGQPLLMHYYAEEFGAWGKSVAQVLLTRDDLGHRERFLNARRTFRELWEIPDVVPIVNENDTVANEEIRFGDNDRLAALVSTVVEADVLVILSDVDGVYDSNPTTNPSAKKVDAVYASDPLLESIAGGSGSAHGTGGMLSKIRAAQIACGKGVPTIIGPGRSQGFLERIFAGSEEGTLLVPSDSRLSARKSWIGFGSKAEGTLLVDEGASRALIKSGKSLLPGGIVSVEGEFSAGAPVDIVCGTLIARGLAGYSASEIRAIRGKNSSEIASILGYHNGDAVVHRDDLTLV